MKAGLEKLQRDRVTLFGLCRMKKVYPGHRNRFPESELKQQNCKGLAKG